MNQQLPEVKGPSKRTGARIGIGCLMVLAGFMLIGSLLMAFNSDYPNHFEATAGYGTFALVIGGIAYLWRRFVNKRIEGEQLVHHEKIVLKHAAAIGGAATLAQIVEATPLSSQEAAAALEHLGSTGLVQYDLLDDGTVLYRFGGLVGE